MKKKGNITPSLMDTLPNNRNQWLQLCIKLSERAISSQENHKDMIKQVERLKSELFGLKSS
jgi:hypothetical protein